jgi:hypothetical protein
MRCPSLAANTTCRHDIPKGTLRREVHRAGIGSTQEVGPRRLPGLARGAGTCALGASSRVEAQGDILLALPGGSTIADIYDASLLSIPSPSTPFQQRQLRPAQLLLNATNRCEPRMHEWSQMASGPGGVDRASFVAGALRELSIGLCRGFFPYSTMHVWKCLQNPLGGGPAGMRVPTDEHGLL